MNFRLKTVSGLALALASFAISASAQKPEPSAEEMRAMREQRAREAQTHAERLKAKEIAGKEAEEKRAGPRRGAGQFLQFTAACKPAKLMPGQTGILMVSAALKGQAVMTAPAPIQILNQIGNPPVTLGQLTAHPAKHGTLAKAYQGQLVYDNVAIFEVPITMGQGKVGERHIVAFDVQFDLHDGNSGNTVGRFIERVSASVEVGLEVDPVVKGGSSREANPEPPVAAKPAIRAATSSAGQPEGGAKPIVGVDPAAVVADVPDDTSGGDTARDASPQNLTDMDVSEDGLPMPLLLGGGGLLLVIVVLMLARKK